MDSMSISARNEFTTLLKNLVSPKSRRGQVYDIIKDFFLKVREAIKKHSHEANRVLPLPEEENVDSNSNDSLRVFTSLPKANIAGKCSKIRLKLRLPYGFFKFMNHQVSAEAREKTPHVASVFDFSGVSGWPLPSSSSNSSSLWILDSGATHHVCYSQASFEPFVPTYSSVTLPNGHTVSVHGTGSVRLCNDLTLQDVLFVPQFHCNLLSISALTQQHPYVVSFHSDHYVIEDPTQGRKIGIGKQANNLYTLDLSQMFFVSP